MLTISHLRQRMFPVWLSVGVTLCLWLGSKWWYADWFTDPFQYPAKAASLTSTLLLCWCFFLSARWRLAENYFGGLDKTYQVHKRLGKWAFLLILVHPVFLAVHRLPDLVSFLAYLWFEPSGNDPYLLGKNLGVAAILPFAGLVIISLRRSVAYHVWKRLHEWMGLVLALTIAHVLLVDADIAAYPLLGIWMYGVLGLAAASFAYTRFLYPVLGPRRSFTVANVEPVGDVREFTLTPKDRPMDFKPSQFVYLMVRKPGITAEPHPYSIASGFSLSGTLKLGIKAVGDHTRSLALLGPGDNVDVYGPYGRFSDLFLNSPNACVFIGAGIGITPFIGMWHVALHTEERMSRSMINERLRRVHPEIVNDWKSPRVALFYISRTLEEASFDDDIKREVSQSPIRTLEELERQGHLYELYLSEAKGRFTAAYAATRLGEGFLDRNFFLCGPTVMMESLIDQLLEMGVPARRIVVEDFNLV